MLKIPTEVQELIRGIFRDCNSKVSGKLSRIPNIHETSLDHTFIEHFTHFCRPIPTPSEWTVRLDCHFIGGGRHYEKWEVADFGILMVFRHRGQVVRSKVALLQSKRLYPNEVTPESNPLGDRLGFNYLFMSEDRWKAVAEPRVFTFSERSSYRALEVADEQYEAIEKYERRHKIPVQYLLYNPVVVPWSMAFPITAPEAPIPECNAGCRVVPSVAMREMVKRLNTERPPTYGQVTGELGEAFSAGPDVGGWRVERYVADLMLTCQSGLVDDSEKFDHISHIFSQKVAPISAAIVITMDMPTGLANAG
jgi:hypothetical protein